MTVSPMDLQVDPDMAPILAAMQEAGPINYAALPITEARAVFERAAAPWCALAPEIASVEDVTLRGAAGPLRARLYRAGEGTLPLVIFVHGGGWTFGSLDSHENEIRHLALNSGAAVLGIDYRLGPEHPFPAPLDDVLAAIAAVQGGVLGDKVDPRRLALAGDSAGANLALGALLALRDAGGQTARCGVLYYGCFAPRFDTESHRLLGDGTYGLSSERMRWYWRNFLGGKLEGAPVLATPLEADPTGLPPLYLVAAGLDPLRDDTLLYAESLERAGVAHQVETVPGVIHGFLRNAARMAAARRSLAAGGAFLKANLKQDQLGG
jgi:acetyl esterase